ncbi:succinylglutamate desuccinylase/aspartoacylase family protein [Halomarina rubra]|uniref:Succinylglutamate desuccinylase/aspartoacylase family protein n=1 Tax=Halomarina rubra TaxID=2071873 RepID=A0ABD6AYN1_9EURY|nr:succinylglutamate desuccinylase/aspartoacylase family protein [Halomarina rubra]
MNDVIELGTASAAPGERARGYWTVTDLPTGTPERLPVVLVNGAGDGPTVWVTAGIHGDEVTALATAQDAVAALDPETLTGAVVCLPSLNPAGLRRTTRTSYYHDDDPNRYFPDGEHDSSRPPRVQELVDRRIFEAFTGTSEAPRADLLLDLHTAQVGSMPFTIRDRVLYGSVRERDEAEELAADLDRLCAAVGLPIVTEYEAEEYTEQNLQRSTAGAALNEAGIPACTVELGSHGVVEEDHRAAGVAGVCRALAAWGLLDTAPDAVEAADPGVDAPVSFPVRRYVGPHTDTAGVVRHHVEASDTVEEGDVVADVVAPTGEHLTTVESDADGYVLGRCHGVAVYENDPVASLAVRDDGDLVVPREGE